MKKSVLGHGSACVYQCVLGPLMPVCGVKHGALENDGVCDFNQWGPCFLPAKTNSRFPLHSPTTPPPPPPPHCRHHHLTAATAASNAGSSRVPNILTERGFPLIRQETPLLRHILFTRNATQPFPKNAGRPSQALGFVKCSPPLYTTNPPPTHTPHPITSLSNQPPYHPTSFFLSKKRRNLEEKNEGGSGGGGGNGGSAV